MTFYVVTSTIYKGNFHILQRIPMEIGAYDHYEIYTERQKKPIISSERHSLKPTSEEVVSFDAQCSSA